MTSVAQRLHDAITRPGPRLLSVRVILTLEDAVALDALLADRCEDHLTCESCGEVACDACGVGEAGYCTHGREFCRGCWPSWCSECRADAAEDHAYDVVRDGAW